MSASPCRSFSGVSPSPAAIYQSLKRRRERLENELGEARLAAKGRRAGASEPAINADMLGNIEEYGQEEIDELEDLISTGATTAETVEQLALEVETLKGLETMALGVLRSGVDTKWSQLNRILDDDLMIDAAGNRRKLIIFTEPKDTLHYLLDKVRARLGNPEAVEVIHGGVSREERRKVVERFMQDRDMLVLIANDAAGEGVNLQRGHLMVNYDLPWNPNKIEQRFGRIHRIGQTEVCHLWNLVAADTREGEFTRGCSRNWKLRARRWAAVSMTCSANCSTAWRSRICCSRRSSMASRRTSRRASSSRSMARSTRRTCSNCCAAAP
jgi:superfamily II DNA/RNA helicase